MILTPIAAFLCLIFFHPGSGQFLQSDCGVVSTLPKSTTATEYIMGGTDAVVASNPWMAYLHKSTKFICGGTLIHKRFVLTAAHCITEGTTLTVRLGEFDSSQSSDCNDMQCLPPSEEYDVDIAFRHRLFSYRLCTNDIGLLRLARSVEFKVHIKPICVIVDPEWQSRVEAVQSFTATGWGRTNSAKTSEVLQRITISRLDRSECTRKLMVKTGPSHICGGHPHGDTCSGDSGGPLIQHLTDGAQKRFVQLGIVSYGNQQCTTPGLYTDVLSHARWIQRVIRQYEN